MAVFLKRIEWLDDTTNTLVYRFPVLGKEINKGSKLTVRESQMAVFVHKGKVADIFLPGFYSLDTDILPILSKLMGWKYGFETPITCEVYFINTKQFTNNKWGTANPLIMRDKEFGMVRVRGFGAYAFKVNDADKFLNELFGTNSSFVTEDIQEFLKSIILSGLSDAIGESNLSVLDLAGNTMEFNEEVKDKIQHKFEEIGLKLTSFIIENMSVPTEVEKAFDERSKLGILGSATDTMMKVAAAESLKLAAANPNGAGFMQAGMGLGAGVGMGNMMGDAFKTSTKDALKEVKVKCGKCGATNAENAKFCIECGAKMSSGKMTCPSCKASIAEDSKFCPECGAKIGGVVICKNCKTECKAGIKFCPECGEKL